jgi:hypothetical protein
MPMNGSECSEVTQPAYRQAGDDAMKVLAGIQIKNTLIYLTANCKLQTVSYLRQNILL